VDGAPPRYFVALGTTHMGIVHEDGGRLTCGFVPGDGRLGQGSDSICRYVDDDGSIPVPVEGIGSTVAQVTASTSHTIAITENGEVYTWGGATGDPVLGSRAGKLGHGSAQDELSPRVVEGMRERSLCVVGCAAGADHTVFLTDENEIFSCGGSAYGATGHGDCTDYSLPRLVTFSADVPVCQVAAGLHHTVALSLSGKVYTCGCNQHGNQRGQLGHGDLAHRHTLQLVERLQDLHTVRISAGNSHTAMVTAEGLLWCCGSDRYGQCGHEGKKQEVPRDESAVSGDGAAILEPQVVILQGWNSVKATMEPRNERVLQVACGAEHTVCLTFDTLVYTFGSSAHGALGVQVIPLLKAAPPRVVAGLRGEQVVNIAAGGCSSAALTAQGQVFTWGGGLQGQLGHGDYEDKNAPQLVESVRCQHTICHIVPEQAILRPGTTLQGITAPAI